MSTTIIAVTAVLVGILIGGTIALFVAARIALGIFEGFWKMF